MNKNNVISSKELLEFSSELNGFKGRYSELEGVLYWEDSNGNTIMGTPNWDGDGLAPFEFSDSEGNLDTISTLYLSNYPTKVEQTIVYFNTLLELTYNIGELKERVSNL